MHPVREARAPVHSNERTANKTPAPGAMSAESRSLSQSTCKEVMKKRLRLLEVFCEVFCEVFRDNLIIINLSGVLICEVLQLSLFVPETLLGCRFEYHMYTMCIRY